MRKLDKEFEQINAITKKDYIWVSTMMFAVLSVMVTTVSFIGTIGIVNPNIIGGIITNNFFTNTWSAASPDARLQFMGTIIVAVPGLTILRSLFKKTDK